MRTMKEHEYDDCIADVGSRQRFRVFQKALAPFSQPTNKKSVYVARISITTILPLTPVRSCFKLPMYAYNPSLSGYFYPDSIKLCSCLLTLCSGPPSCPPVLLGYFAHICCRCMRVRLCKCECASKCASKAS